MKKSKDELRGNPILLEIHYTQNSLVGRAINANAKLKDDIMIDYDFITAPIDGFEAYSQYYVFEKNLEKLKPFEEMEKVCWDDEYYNKFLEQWRRTSC